MILNQSDFFGKGVQLNGAIADTATEVTLAGLSTRFTDAVTAGTAGYEGTSAAIGPFRISDADGFELIAITGHLTMPDNHGSALGGTIEAGHTLHTFRSIIASVVHSHNNHMMSIN